MFPQWVVVVAGAIALQLFAGLTALVVGSAMAARRPRAGGAGSRSFGPRLAAIGYGLLGLALAEFAALVIAIFVWAQAERFA